MLKDDWFGQVFIVSWDLKNIQIIKLTYYFAVKKWSRTMTYKFNNEE